MPVRTPIKAGRPRAGRRRWALVPLLALCWLGVPAAAEADDPEVRAYPTGGYSGDGDPGLGFLDVTVTNAPACALPAGGRGPDVKASRGVRVASGGRRLFPSNATGPEDRTGTEVTYSGADDLVIALPAPPAGGTIPLRLDCRDRAGTWVTVLDRPVPYPGSGRILPVLNDLVVRDGEIGVYDVSAQYGRPPKITAAALTAEVEGRPAQVRAGARAGVMSVRVPAGVAPGARLLTLRSGDQVTTVPIVNGFAVEAAPPPAVRPAPPREPAPSSVLRSVPTLTQLKPTPATVGLTVGAAAVLMVLIAFPAQPFNRTLEENEEQIRRVFHRLGRRRRDAGAASAQPVRRRVPPLPAFAGFCVLAAALAVLVDTHVTALGADAAVLFAGFLVAVPLTTLTYAGVVELYARLFSGVRGTLGVLGWALGLAAVCALVSRLAGFEPGYVYGLIAGFVVVRDGRRVRSRGLSAERGGATVLAGAVSVLVLSLAAYMVLDQLHGAALKDGAALWLRLLDAVLVATFVTGVQTIVFGLLPLTFMDGDLLFRWSRPVWATVYGTGLAVFVYVLVLKHGDARQRHQAGDLARGLWLFLAFGVLSLLVWGFFRYRPAPAGAAVAGATRRHGWAWFAAGAVLPAVLILAGGVWATTALGGVGPARASVPAPASPAPASAPVTPAGATTPAATAGPATPATATVTCEKATRTVTDYRGVEFVVRYCPTARAGELYRSPGGAKSTGYLRSGRNWFACQRQGVPDSSGTGGTWLYTQGDEAYEHAGWGWFPASLLTSAGTAPSLPGLPVCAADVPG